MSTAIETKGVDHGPACCCPACHLLQCMERSRYSTGMVLSAAELTKDQDWVVAKNRLHNRYLHGYGVVCGLEVLPKNECKGWVTIRRGYAIDPCGNDIIVCHDEALNVIEAVKACGSARRQAQKTPCDPWRPAPKEPDCDEERYWCITLEYRETEARPMASLRNPPRRGCSCGRSCSCDCNCGGSCTCGGRGNCCRHSAAEVCGCGAQPISPAPGSTITTTVYDPFTGAPKVLSGVAGIAVCEPTRVREGYCLNVIPVCEEGCPPLRERLLETPLARLRRCINRLSISLDKVGGRQFIAEVLSGDITSVPADVYRFVVEAIKQQEREGPECGHRKRATPTIHGMLLERGARMRVGSSERLRRREVNPNEVPGSEVAEAIVEYITWCTCCSCGCPDDPCDDRLLLACVTVNLDEGTVSDIDEAGCRRNVAGACTAVDPCLQYLPLVLAHWDAAPLPGHELPREVQARIEALELKQQALSLELASALQVLEAAAAAGNPRPAGRQSRTGRNA